MLKCFVCYFDISNADNYLFKYWDRIYKQIQGKSGEILLLIVGCESINRLFNIDWLIDWFEGSFTALR